MDRLLSYLMGGDDIQDSGLENLGIEIVSKTSEGYRMLKIPPEKLNEYKELIKRKMTPLFWNEIIGPKEIIFIFKFKDQSIEEYKLSPSSERKIDKLCAEFNNKPPDKTANVYKYISENKFYHDLMVEHYSELINR